MEKCKTKAIQADIGIFTHILAYSDTCKHKQAYSQAYSEPSVTLAYLEPWYIQNQKHIQNRDVFRTLAYSEPCQTSTMECFRENSYYYYENNYFHNISF